MGLGLLSDGFSQCISKGQASVPSWLCLSAPFALGQTLLIALRVLGLELPWFG